MVIHQSKEPPLKKPRLPFDISDLLKLRESAASYHQTKSPEPEVDQSSVIVEVDNLDSINYRLSQLDRTFSKRFVDVEKKLSSFMTKLELIEQLFLNRYVGTSTDSSSTVEVISETKIDPPLPRCSTSFPNRRRCKIEPKSPSSQPIQSEQSTPSRYFMSPNTTRGNCTKRTFKQEVKEETSPFDHTSSTGIDSNHPIQSSINELQVLIQNHKQIFKPDLFEQNLPPNWFFYSLAELAFSCLRFYEDPIKLDFLFDAVRNVPLVNRSTGDIVKCCELTAAWRHHLSQTFNTHKGFISKRGELYSLSSTGKLAFTCIGTNSSSTEGFYFEETLRKAKRLNVSERIAPPDFRFRTVYDYLVEQ
ncbi:hypothetical protein RCL1_000405 [Eukaryota sp. TZLM3-RCL]